jgi:hypothetical protein
MPLNITPSGATVFTTQPCLSAQWRKLILAVALFVRRHKRLEPVVFKQNEETSFGDTVF